MATKTAWPQRPHRLGRHRRFVGISLAKEVKQYPFPRKRTGSIVLACVQTASTSVGISLTKEVKHCRAKQTASALAGISLAKEVKRGHTDRIDICRHCRKIACSIVISTASAGPASSHSCRRHRHRSVKIIVVCFCFVFKSIQRKVLIDTAGKSTIPPEKWRTGSDQMQKREAQE